MIRPLADVVHSKYSFTYLVLTVQDGGWSSLVGYIQQSAAAAVPVCCCRDWFVGGTFLHTGLWEVYHHRHHHHHRRHHFISIILLLLFIVVIVRRNRSCGASDSAYCYTFLCSVVCLSVVCHICAPCLNCSKDLDAMWQVHLWVAVMTHCVRWGSLTPRWNGRFGGWTPSKLPNRQSYAAT